VTGFELDARLRRAFASLAESPGPELSDEVRERIWLAVSGELPPGERAELVERTAWDPVCAEAWRAAHELWLALQEEPASQESIEPAVVPARTTCWTSPWLAAAAALLVATVGVVSLLDRPPADEYRTSPGHTVESLVRGDMPLSRDAFRLRWTPGPDGSRYQVRVTTEDLQVLATAADLTVAELVVEPAAFASLPDGATVFWQVDVSLPTGERITSRTFAVHVQ
jgi:hypothetical protein